LERRRGGGGGEILISRKKEKKPKDEETPYRGNSFNTERRTRKKKEHAFRREEKSTLFSNSVRGSRKSLTEKGGGGFSPFRGRGGKSLREKKKACQFPEKKVMGRKGGEKRFLFCR